MIIAHIKGRYTPYTIYSLVATLLLSYPDQIQGPESRLPQTLASVSLACIPSPHDQRTRADTRHLFAHKR